MESRLVETAGGRTRRSVYEGGAAPLLFLRGVGASFDDSFLAALAAPSRRGPALPGYEDSEAPSLRTMGRALWAFDVLEALGSRAARGGHSLGRMIAAEMAALCPREISGSCSWRPPACGSTRTRSRTSSRDALQPHAPLPRRRAGASCRRRPPAPRGRRRGAFDLAALVQRFDDPRFLQDFLIQNARRLGMAGKLLFPIPDRGLGERLYRVRARSTLVWGDADRLIDPAYASAWQRLLPEARLVRVPDAGHMLPYERPDAVLEEIA
jgi:pimeloyl-ACP methyl ester carboxylesterase